jgi:hypothetical protein
LGPAGADLWTRILSAYDLPDEGGRQLLYEACCAADRASQLKVAIDRDGATVMTRTGPKIHPGLKPELEQRAFVAKCLQRLGLDLEPLRPGPGRPPDGGTGITWRQLDDK